MAIRLLPTLQPRSPCLQPSDGCRRLSTHPTPITPHHTHPAPSLVTARDRKPPIGSSQPGWSTGRPPTARSSIFFSFDFLQCFKASAGTQRSPSLPTHPTPAHSDDGKSTITNSRGKRINRRTDRWTSRHHHHPHPMAPRERNSSSAINGAPLPASDGRFVRAGCGGDGAMDCRPSGATHRCVTALGGLCTRPSLTRVSPSSSTAN